MLFLVAGDAHGRLDRLYRDVHAFEAHLNRRTEHLLHVGDFGIWPEPARMNPAIRERDGAGDFSRWLSEKKAAPRPTTFIQGNHEDFEWLRGRHEVLPDLHFLANGRATVVTTAPNARGTADGESLRVGGVGGCFGPSDYARPGEALRGSARCHYAHDELERLCAEAPLDVVLFHDAPKGVVFRQDVGSADERTYTSEAEGLAEALEQIRPKLCFFGHHHIRCDVLVRGVQCVGLSAVGERGSIVAVEARHGELHLLGDWPH